MKCKFLPLLAGMAAIAIAAKPVIATAESPILIAQQTAQFAHPFKKIDDLTDSQNKQMQVIWEGATQAIFTVVTPAQQQRFLEARQNGKTLDEAREAMGLSAAQKQKISQILQEAKQQSWNILTPEQRNKVEILPK